jgi:hypothetical protein
LSDISLNWGLIDYALIALITSSPGLAVGVLCGAIGWRAHRILGGMLGAIIGSGVCLGGFLVWVNADSSLTVSFHQALLLALEHGLPGFFAGAALGAGLWRNRRISGAVWGALGGVALWLSGWCYFTGTL